jgi:glutaredoxin
MFAQFFRFFFMGTALFLSFAEPNQAMGENMNDLEISLFYRPTCPFCQKVIAYMDKHQIILPMEDISDKEQQQQLVSIGGKSQVPCLVINGKALYESDDIITWMQEHLERS